VTKGQQAIRELANAMRDATGNLPPMSGVFPDYAAPIIRTGADGVRELSISRKHKCNFLTSPRFLPPV
jgi:hypothetical protein